MLQVIASHVSDYSSRGIAEGISRAIRDGTLSPGTRLPPIRHMAAQFQCSPTTVSTAWGLLARAGLIHTDRRRGTIVIEQVQAKRGRYRQALGRTAGLALDLSTGVPDPALLPDISAALGRLRIRTAEATYLTEPVLPALREHLTSDWPYEPEVITVTDGAMDALDLLVTTHLQFGDRVAVEDPCFPPLIDLLESIGVRIVPVRTDSVGLEPASLEVALGTDPRAVFLQPRAQNPTGSSMTAERSAEIAHLLADHDTMIVENDSAGEVATTSLHSVGEHLPGRTVHVRSYSKSHGPDLRLAAVGGPRWIVEPLVNRRFQGQSWTSHLLQGLLLDLLTHEESVREVSRARSEYARRRAALAEALHDRGIETDGGDGLNLWVPVADEPAALIMLSAHGIGVAPGSPFIIAAGASPHIRVTSALLDGPVDAIADALAEAATP